MPNPYRFLLLIALLGSCGLLALSADSQQEWTLKRSLDGMQTFTRDRAGSDIKEVKLVMEVDATIDDLNAVLGDATRQPEWVYRCLEARDLGGSPDTGWFYYSRIDLPWPMDDRDLVARVQGDQDNDLYISKSYAAPDRTARVDDCVRITDFDVTTSYRALDNGARTEVVYQLHSEPGGKVPAWMVNMFIDKGPIETMTKLRDIVER